MEEKSWLNKETFLCMANACGLDMDAPHLDELYVYVQKVLLSIRVLQEIDLTNVEPMIFIPDME